MSLDINKLELVKHTSGKIIAQCPACANEGQDQTGNHLFIDSEGRFGCVVYPGKTGDQHRKKIFELVGIRKYTSRAFTVKEPSLPDNKIIIPSILGRLGRLSFTSKQKEIPETELNKDCLPVVPNVPDPP
jgi:hypothetical protein